jgi:hypothetical protein
MLDITQPADTSGVIGPLSLPGLIVCLEERLEVMRQAGTHVEIGSLAELLDEAVCWLREMDALLVRIVAEARRDGGGQ